MTNTAFYPASERGHLDHGWLDTYHSFSFASWYDPSKIHFGALRVLNDDTIEGGMGFGTHPHDNMEIITVVLTGELEHKDSMGNIGTIKADEVQVMSAGTGITHSEYNHNADEACSLFQLWIFPQKKNVTPRYDQKVYSPQARKDKMQMLVSPMDSSDEGLKIHQQAWIYRGNIGAGKEMRLSPHTSAHGFYIMNVDGEFSADGQQLAHRDAVGISGGGEVKLSAAKDSDVLIVEVPMQF